MERILSDNEKVRRAEEIYYRRNHRNVNMTNHEVKTKTYLGSKIVLEMLILLLLAVIVFAIKNREYIFTQEFLANISEYNVNLTEKFDFVKEFLGDENVSDDTIFIKENEEVQEQNQAEVQENIQEQVQDNPNPTEEVQQESQQSLIQGSDNFKNEYSFIRPIEGTVTSRFGSRESKYQNVSGNHTGIDISASSGTEIKSVMDGVVSQVSTKGDYGNHVKITHNNVDTLYAHCQDILVLEGQVVSQGDVIATVGSTGNSTGPHLHFEVRVDGECINPDEIIQF